jgi:hypothetical protein
MNCAFDTTLLHKLKGGTPSTLACKSKTEFFVISFMFYRIFKERSSKIGQEGLHGTELSLSFSFHLTGSW